MSEARCGSEGGCGAAGPWPAGATRGEGLAPARYGTGGGTGPQGLLNPTGRPCSTWNTVPGGAFAWGGAADAVQGVGRPGPRLVAAPGVPDVLVTWKERVVWGIRRGSRRMHGGTRGAEGCEWGMAPAAIPGTRGDRTSGQSEDPWDTQPSIHVECCVGLEQATSPGVPGASPGRSLKDGDTGATAPRATRRSAGYARGTSALAATTGGCGARQPGPARRGPAGRRGRLGGGTADGPRSTWNMAFGRVRRQENQSSR